MPGLIVDRYQILDSLGGGKVSEVYRVKDLVTGRILALKTTRTGVTHEEELALNREFYHLSRFHHPNIVTVADFGASSDGRHYFTMEFFDGKPFNSHFQGYSDALLPAMIQTLQALDAIHCQGLCHCDVKPHNILVAASGADNDAKPGQGDWNGLKVKLLDFGFAERISFMDQQSGRGTLGYIAPEVFKGTGVDARADIYSLGMVVYEVLTGKGPQSAGDILSWLKKQYSGDLPRPSAVGAKVPEEFESIVWRMIQRNPEDRPRSCLEVMEALSRMCGMPVQLPAAEEPQNYLLATGFVGRNDLLAKIGQLLTDARAKHGNIVFISGERGIGKSRLMSEFKFLAQLSGATIFPFTPASLGARPQSLLESVMSYLKDYHNIDVARELTTTTRPSWSNSGSEGADIELEPRDRSAEVEKFRLYECTASALRGLAASDKIPESLLLLIDDFELFDPPSLEFLRYLISSIEQDRILVAVCGLNERRLLELIKDFKTTAHVHHFPLVPLAQWETTELISSVLGPIPQLEDLSHWIQESTGGNPLFVIETIYSLIDKKILVLSASRWTVRAEELKAYRVPDTISEVIKLRLRRLSPDELEILRIGAVSGSPLTIEFLRVVLGFEEQQLFNAVGRLKGMGLMRPYAGETVSSLILSSKMLESVVIETITAAERRETHRRVALALELLYPDQLNRLIFDLAHHYTQAGMKDRAYAYSLKAGDRAYAYHLTDQALAYYETALANAAPTITSTERLQLLQRIGLLRETLGHYPEAIDTYMQATATIVADKQLSANTDLMPEHLRLIGRVHQKQDKQAEALQYFDQAYAMLKGRTNLLSVNLLNDMAWSHRAQGNFNRAERLLNQVLQTAARSVPTSGTAVEPLSLAPTLRAQYYLAVVEWYRGNADRALKLVQTAIKDFQQINENGRYDASISHLTQHAATLQWSKGNFQQARLLYEQCLPIQRKSNDIFYLLRTLIGLGNIKNSLADTDGALQDFQEALTLAQRIHNRQEIALILNNLGALHEDLGQWEKAREYYLATQEMSIQKGDDTALCTSLANLAAIAAKQGELDQAETLLKDAQTISTRLTQPLYQQPIALAQTRLEIRRERLALAKPNLIRAFRLNLQHHDLRQRPDLRIAAAEFHIANSEPAKAVLVLRPLVETINLTADRDLNHARLHYAIALGQLRPPEVTPQARDTARQRALTTLQQVISDSKRLRIPYDAALAQLALATLRITTDQPESLLRFKPQVALRALDHKEVSQALEEVKQARDAFQQLGAKHELQRATELLERITQLQTSGDLKPRHQGDLLTVYYELSQIINQGLEQEDFMDRILDIVIQVTGAERGLLFLNQNDKLIAAAARHIDHTTLHDAQNISRSLLKQVRRRAEPVITSDALADPRFSATDSVTLNKIRSILCVPLLLDQNLVGVIYLDSRVNTHLFWEEDRSFLVSVANYLAATIDKSLAFKKIQDDVNTWRDEILTDAATGYYLGKSKPMRYIYHLIQRIAPTSSNVLIMGETGSGKTVIARLIHETSTRKGQPWVTINCGTLPESLFESELFGHAKGSFTGAIKDKTGLLETAHGGTVFLDEITNTSLSTQAKLLEAIEQKTIRRVGETQVHNIDIRFICATNRDLIEEVKAGRFREDLYYRLNVVSLTVPPLRTRSADIPELAAYLLRRSTKDLNKALVGFEPEAISALVQHPWPGNVRELQNVIERAAIMAQKRKITITDLGTQFASADSSAALQELDGVTSPIGENATTARRGSVEREQLVKTLVETNGNISEAAKRLNTHRRQVQRLVKRYNIDRNNPT
jgi:transcriptional regulator with GAF, ATPase, and Fis domain/serine/threonine protein kinase/tetratricopeptide (TPR) repeat protein